MKATRDPTPHQIYTSISEQTDKLSYLDMHRAEESPNQYNIWVPSSKPIVEAHIELHGT